MKDAVQSLDTLLIAVMEERRDQVRAWLRDEPGSWGYLAGQGVLAWRRQLGRPLTDSERRLVWRHFWRLLSYLKQEMPGS